MHRRKSIGIGGVMAEVAWLSQDNTPVKEKELLKGLCTRFGVDTKYAMYALDLAETCGVVERNELGVTLKPRPE